MTEVHKVVLLIVDFDKLGAHEVAGVLKNTRYPNHCIYPRVMSVTTQKVEWTDDHPLNKRDTTESAFAELFPDEHLRTEVKRLEDEHEKVYEILEAVFDADIAALPPEVRDAVLKYRYPMDGF